MARALIEAKSVQGLFDLASKILGYNLVDLCAQGPQEKLNTTLYSQPAIFVCSLAAMEKAKADAPDMLKKVKPAQLGAIRRNSLTPAPRASSGEGGGGLLARRVLGARLRRRDVVRGRPPRGEGARRGDGAGGERHRGRDGVGGGASDDALQTALDKAAAIVDPTGKAKAYIANYMFPEERTCSGDKAVLEKMCELVVEMGAKNAKMVNVSGAFHTPYMAAASEALGKTLDEAEIKMPSISSTRTSPASRTRRSTRSLLLKRRLLSPSSGSRAPRTSSRSAPSTSRRAPASSSRR